MLRLTREIRFSVHPADSASRDPVNGHGGVPAMQGLGYFFTLRVSLTGDIDPASSYLCNIKKIDDAVRRLGIPVIEHAVHERPFRHAVVLSRVYAAVAGAWPGMTLAALEWGTTPFQMFSILATEPQMIRLSQRFEFSAAHRLHNPALDDATNVATFGKCNNLEGHGHNYELQVTLSGTPDANGMLMHVSELERVVAETVLDRLDHRHLNVQVPEFADVNPSVENIARVIYSMLSPALRRPNARLASVTVWETPKTWCEYSE